MLWITLNDVKAQVKVATADTTQDERLTRLGNSAETFVAKRLNQVSAAALETYGLSGTSPPVLPDDMRSAMLLHVEMHYALSPADAPAMIRAIDDLLQPYRVEGTGV